MVSRWLVLFLLVGCSKTEKQTDTRPVSAEEAAVFGTQWEKAAFPCDKTRVAELVDSDAFKRRMAARASDYEVAEIGAAMLDRHAVAAKVCGWTSRADRYTYLRTRTVDGRLRAVLRRATGAGGTYHEIDIVRSSDGVLRAADAYSYFKGEWISEGFASQLGAVSDDKTGLAVGVRIARATMIEDAQPAEALAILDGLPPKVRDLRSTQGWRVKLSQNISMEAYAAALEELFRHFPNDPSVALLQVDGAYLRGDITGALGFIDKVDSQIGPDPMLDGTRAMMLAARNAEGDLALAASKAEDAVAAAPEVQSGYWGRVAVALARGDWTTGLKHLEELSNRFGVPIDDAALRDGHMFTELLTTPEYRQWRAK